MRPSTLRSTFWLPTLKMRYLPVLQKAISSAASPDLDILSVLMA